MAFSMCRVCLVGNSKMVDIDNIHLRLREMYEKLTNTVLNAEAGTRMPSTICYVCYRHLQKCHMFSNMAQISNRILRELLYNTDEESHPSFILPSHETMCHLVVTPTQHIYFNICSNTASISPITVKEEQIAVKVEKANENINDEPLEGVEKSNDLINMELSQENDINVKTSSMSPCFCCDVCYKKFSYKCLLVKHLKSHKQIHTKKRPYSCNWCDKPFTRKNDWRRHIQVHTGENVFSCNRCSKTFICKNDLTVHMRFHTGERPYSCKMCSKAFIWKSDLTIHMRVHIKPFSCDTCGKAFTLDSSLTKHLQVHTRIKPYSCNKCNKAFVGKNDLTVHM